MRKGRNIVLYKAETYKKLLNQIQFDNPPKKGMVRMKSFGGATASKTLQEYGDVATAKPFAKPYESLQTQSDFKKSAGYLKNNTHYSTE